MRSSTALYANHCIQSGGQCTINGGGDPDGNRIGSHQATWQNDRGGGLGNWADIHYCCGGPYAGMSCYGYAFRTTSEAQAGWCPSHSGPGYFGSDTFAVATCTMINVNCPTAEWSGPSGVDYDYAIFLR